MSGDLADLVETRLRGQGTPERAIREKAYLKSDLEFVGVSVPGIRSVMKAIRRDNPQLDHGGLVQLVKKLWRKEIHECRMAAVELLDAYSELLSPDDLGLIELKLREAKTWALVDTLATSVVGDVVVHHPESAEILDRWAADSDFWLRRAALLALLVPLRNGGGDFDRFSRYADAMVEDKEFFIRKAIGWVLRDTSKRRPDLVYRWLCARAHRLSGVTVGESVRHLPDDQATGIMAAYRAKVAVDP